MCWDSGFLVSMKLQVPQDGQAYTYQVTVAFLKEYPEQEMVDRWDPKVVRPPPHNHAASLLAGLPAT